MIFSKFKSHFQQGSAARDVAALTMGTVIAQGITIAVTPLLTRLYAPSDFGLLAVFLAVVSVGATLVTLRYETSILVPKENGESANLVLLSLILGLGVSVVLGLIGVLLPIGLQEKVGLGALGNWLPIAFLTAGAVSIFAVMQGWMNRQKKYQLMARMRVGQSAGTAGLALFFGFLQVNFGLLIAQIFASFCMCFVALWLGRSAAFLWKQQQLRETAFSHKNAPKYILPTSLLDVVTLQLPVILISAWYGANEAGQFSMAWRLLMIPMALIGGAVGQVFMQRFSNAIGNPLLAKKIIKQSWLILFAMGLIPFFCVFTIGDHIFIAVLGEEWANSGALAKILAPMAFAMFISSPTSGAFIILGIQKYSPFFGLASLIYRPIALLVGYWVGNIYTGIVIWVLCEIVQISTYQVVAWKNITKVRS